MSNRINLTEVPSTLSTSHIADLFNVYILPPICLAGVLLNLLSSIVSFHFRHNRIFFYMLISSFSDMTFLFINFFLIIIRCGSLCPIGYTYASKVYEIFIYLYIGSTLLMFSSLLEILVLIHQYAIIKQIDPIKSINKYYILTLLAIVSLGLNTPVFIIRKIGINAYSNHVVELNDFGRSDTGRYVSIIYGLVRGLLLMIFLFIPNVMLSIEFRKYVAKKRRIKSVNILLINSSNLIFVPSKLLIYL